MIGRAKRENGYCSDVVLTDSGCLFVFVQIIWILPEKYEPGTALSGKSNFSGKAPVDRVMDLYRIGLDNDILEVLASEEAQQVTPLLASLYLRLLQAPMESWEGDCVIRLKAAHKQTHIHSPWEQVLDLLRVEPGLALKTIEWLGGRNLIIFHEDKQRDEILILFRGLQRLPNIDNGPPQRN